MAKQVIPEELDALIQEYLTDGIISAKERQVLLNKAASLGLNVDEVDLYIDAQQQKADQQVDAAVRKQRGQTCPFCGGSVPDLTDKCPHCGQHITVQANEEIKEIIENLENALVDLKSGKDIARSRANVEKYLRKAELYYSNNPKIKQLNERVKEELANANKKYKAVQRANFIKKYWAYILFGVILLIEVIMWWSFSSAADASLSNYHNYVGSRMDTYSQYESADGKAVLMIFAIIATVALGIYLKVKLNKKED